jgi:hypothetical protein
MGNRRPAGWRICPPRSTPKDPENPDPENPEISAQKSGPKFNNHPKPKGDGH